MKDGYIKDRHFLLYLTCAVNPINSLIETVVSEN